MPVRRRGLGKGWRGGGRQPGWLLPEHDTFQEFLFILSQPRGLAEAEKEPGGKAVPALPVLTGARRGGGAEAVLAAAVGLGHRGAY